MKYVDINRQLLYSRQELQLLKPILTSSEAAMQVADLRLNYRSRSIVEISGLPSLLPRKQIAVHFGADRGRSTAIYSIHTTSASDKKLEI